MRKRVHSKALLFFVLAIAFLACRAREKGDCYPSSCGDIRNISSPFRLTDDPKHCGYPEYNLSCDSNQTVLYLHSQKFSVKAIDYENQVIQIAIPNLHSNDCSSFPNYNVLEDYHLYGNQPYVLSTVYYDGEDYKPHYWSIAYLNCSFLVMDNPFYCKANRTHFSGSSCKSLFLIRGDIGIDKLDPSCRILGRIAAPVEPQRVWNFTCPVIHHVLLDKLAMGFNLSWKVPLSCRDCWQRGYGCSTYDRQFGYFFVPYLIRSPRGHCYNRCKTVFGSAFCFFWFLLSVMEIACRFITVFFMGRTFIGIICVFTFLVYKFQKRHIWMDTTIEEFLSRYRNHTPTRYSYSQIRKMTGHFKEKLGRGGYGLVYKGTLRNGRAVAIKVLSGESKGNGQEFINEVATIGRIHHVNVVQLIGFCAEASKRALIYEFMPNGSLEKYIYPQEGKTNTLSWDKIYQIALGIARGIKYLHQGCDMKILHFDIKPHNILLDGNFNPKVSDFGLAKFYPTDQSIVSVTAVRGTIGYIAPELFYKVMGGVSYKSDVYSFGMLLMEMAGRRRNVDAYAKNSSQIYFPLWMYDQLDQGGEMGMEDATDDEKEIAKKLAIIGLWCIQMKPADRPSMSKVVEMLEGSVELLQMPAKPFLSSPERVDDENHADELSSSIYEIRSTSQCY